MLKGLFISKWLKKAQLVFAVQLHFKNTTCISDTGFFYYLNIFNSNLVFLKLKKALVTTRSLICIRIQVGCSSSLCCPGGQQHTTQPCAFSDVCPFRVPGERKGPQASEKRARKGIHPCATRSVPGAGRFLPAIGRKRAKLGI